VVGCLAIPLKRQGLKPHASLFIITTKGFGDHIKQKMKNLILILLLFTVFNSLSQEVESNLFKSYFIKEKDLTADRIVKFNNKFNIEQKSENQFKLELSIGQDILNAQVSFIEKTSFGGTSYYQYDGNAMINGEPNRISIESSVGLESFAKGLGYKEYSNQDLQLFEIHFFYWASNIEEPLIKSNFYLYPINNLAQGDRDYIKTNDSKKINLKHVLKREKVNSKITGTYDLNDYIAFRVIELENNQILFSLSFGAIGYIEGLSHFENKISVFENNVFGPCKFQITFKKNNQIAIKTVKGNGGSDCGFGNRAYISHEEQLYVKVSNETPNIRKAR
tara:strand:- start:250639 stop:251640 length:1002 start_codon:yes stop_codon:yes gene_type:complete